MNEDSTTDGGGVPKLVLNYAEAGHALSVSERWLRDNLDAIPHKKFGSRVVFPLEALRAWVNGDIETAKKGGRRGIAR